MAKNIGRPYKFFASDEVPIYLINYRLLKSPKLPMTIWKVKN